MRERFLEGKVAFITGAYRNLGAVIALQLAGNGADIVINDLPGILDKNQKQDLLSQIEAYGVRALAMDNDISSVSFVNKIRMEILDKLGQVSILINCAGPFNCTPFKDLKEEEWDTVMDVNLKAVYITAQCFAADMQVSGWGRIINMSAGSSFIRNHGVYGLAKAGVNFLTESLALELGPEITVNAIAPGQIEESLPYINEIDPTFGAKYIQRTPLKKFVKRAEVAGLISFLCSSAADLMTGETLKLNGGAELPRF